MNENIPPETGTPEPAAQQPETPSWALDKFKRNTVVGGAAVAGAVVALIGASLVGDDDHGRGERMGFRGGPPQMQGGGQFQGPPPGMQGQGQGQGKGQDGGPQNRPGQSDGSDSN